jgi:peptidoglycan/LPS O-acetylase OafA/YrhL
MHCLSTVRWTGRHGAPRVEILATPAILLFWFARQRLGWAGLASLTATLALLSFARGLYGEDMLGRYVFAFGLGMLIHDLPQIGPSRARTALAILATISAISARPILTYHAQSAIIVEAICAAYVLALLVHGGLPTFQALLDHSFLRVLGRVSYSFYLINFLVLLTVVRHLPGPISVLAFGNPYAAALLAWFIIVVVSIPIAAALHRWVELPSIMAGRKVLTAETKR